MASVGYTYKARPFWSVRLRFLKYLIEEFDDGGFFYDWQFRIAESHKQEESSLLKRYVSPTGNIDPNDEELAAEDYSEIERLTSSLYATLVVATWARLEFFLKVLAQCSESASGVVATGKKKKQPYKFAEIKERIEKNSGIKIELAKSFDMINTVRIINNCYKHSDGTYDTQQRPPIDIIHSGLPKVLSAIDAHGQINFDQLPFDDIMNGCHEFCEDVHSKMEQALAAKMTTP